MNCPQCHDRMEGGIVKPRSTALGFMFYGMSYKHLQFETQDGQRFMAVHNSQPRSAWRCAICGSIFLPPDERYPPLTQR